MTLEIERKPKKVLIVFEKEDIMLKNLEYLKKNSSKEQYFLLEYEQNLPLIEENIIFRNTNKYDFSKTQIVELNKKKFKEKEDTNSQILKIKNLDDALEGIRNKKIFYKNNNCKQGLEKVLIPYSNIENKDFVDKNFFESLTKKIYENFDEILILYDEKSLENSIKFSLQIDNLKNYFSSINNLKLNINYNHYQKEKKREKKLALVI